jgi:hypothetical protein
MSLFNDPTMRALENALKSGRGWGNIIYEEERAARAKETSAERVAREKKAAENTQELLQKANIAKKRTKFLNYRTGTLKKIAKKCKWQCMGEKCWAHEGKACPYIHKGDPGWNEKTAVTKKGGKRTLSKKRRTMKRR